MLGRKSGSIKSPSKFHTPQKIVCLKIKDETSHRQKGIILPALFSMMVLMGIVTTLMASPVFELARQKGELGATPTEA
jgi:hypothetical protein